MLLPFSTRIKMCTFVANYDPIIQEIVGDSRLYSEDYYRNVLKVIFSYLHSGYRFRQILFINVKIRLGVFVDQDKWKSSKPVTLVTKQLMPLWIWYWFVSWNVRKKRFFHNRIKRHEKLSSKSSQSLRCISSIKSRMVKKNFSRPHSWRFYQEKSAAFSTSDAQADRCCYAGGHTMALVNLTQFLKWSLQGHLNAMMDTRAEFRSILR